MKGLIITFSFLWLISHATSGKILDVLHNAIPISITDVLGVTHQKNNHFNSLQIIQSYGYVAEAHTVTTEDGYILALHRIPGKAGSPAVFLQHGILGSSADWLIVEKNQSLPFLLADQGYDVWFGNFRGNTYSRAHVNLTTNDRRFWDFSWHESGIYDLPAMINYIVQTKQSLLRAYIGYSMGTTAFFVLSSERPQVTRMVQSAYLLAPIAYLQYQKSPVLQHLSLAKDPLKTTFDILSHGEFLQDDVVLRKFMKYICSFNILEEKICSNVFFSIVGFDNKEFDYKLMPKLVNYLPAGGSIKQIVHYAQSIQYGYFRQYDYGRYKNLKIYNSIEPPKYNISRIITPIAMFWGENDWLSTPKDVARFVKKLPHKPIFYTVPYKKFNHLDFLVAKDVRELVFDKLIDILTDNKLNLHLET